MSAKEQTEREQAVRYGLKSLSGGLPMEKMYGLLALRTVAFHLRLPELHKEISQLVNKAVEVKQ